MPKTKPWLRYRHPPEVGGGRPPLGASLYPNGTTPQFVGSAVNLALSHRPFTRRNESTTRGCTGRRLRRSRSVSESSRRRRTLHCTDRVHLGPFPLSITNDVCPISRSPAPARAIFAPSFPLVTSFRLSLLAVLYPHIGIPNMVCVNGRAINNNGH